jgi:OOP family OmpA-OmpF porin
MINLKKISALAAVSAMLLPVSVFAGEYNNPVQSTNGNIAVNTFGNCVVSTFTGASGECEVAADIEGLTKEMRTVYFDFNKSTLNAKEKAKLDQVSKIIKGSKAVENVSIVGFADEIGKPAYNKALSTKRAQTVKSYLATKGLKTKNIVVKGKGEDSSITSCADVTDKKEKIACLAKDRRVEIMLNLKK